MLRLLLLPCLLALLSLTACQSTQKSTPTLDTPDAARAAALSRSSRLSDVNYQYQLTLTSDGFNGKADISFSLTEVTAPLSIDAVGMQLNGVTINGSYLYPDYDGKQLTLAPALLQSGENQLQLSFSGHYQAEGNGLISYIDPQDGQRYLYSHFEPDGASHLLPLFDQPDLPARFTLEVVTPSQWQVIGNSQPQACHNGQTGHCVKFSTQPKLPLSPHNMSLHAGPFVHWQRQGELPLGLYARQSQQHLVQSDIWLEQTQSNLQQLQQVLDTPFPFAKYDQLLMMQDDNSLFTEPHSGAASVAFIRSSEPDNTLLRQQLARQWFGNMVSIDWWHSRWLSDAISLYLAGSEASAIVASQARDLAYQTDELQMGGHAVGEPAHYLSGDPIIRTKAVAALKQLELQIGKDKLLQIMKAFLQQYQGKAAGAGAFISIAQATAGVDLSKWKQDFIDTRGVNRLQARLDCREGVVETLTLQQLPDSQGKLRTQKLMLGLYHTDRSGVHLDRHIPVLIQGQYTLVDAAANLVCPDFIWPNEEELAYLRVIPDEHSLFVSGMKLGRIHNKQTSLLLWLSMWQSLLSGELSAEDYLAKVLLNAPEMTDADTSELLQQHLLALKQYIAASNSDNAWLIDAMAQLSLQRAMETSAFPALQQTWLDTYIQLARSREALDHLQQWLEHVKGPLPPLTEEQKFRALLQLTRYDHPAANKEIQKLRKRQQLTELQSLQLRAISPKASEKRALLAKLPLLNEADREAVMSVLYPPEQQLLSQASADQRLALIQDNSLPLGMREQMAAYLPYRSCNQDSTDKLQRLSKQSPQRTIAGLLERQALWVAQCIRINQSL
ncbi:hypothetical protein L2750_08280 [Shewanella submarina]|uniref:M1 family aminopeptidase n=1 Tax=Shewanella submarina TaxID=2016376 RepID=A0ABV7G818_9GAMM|nr:M1 family aminopeptidase [Shewanella submarina]MCL1037149.1 hypothetical protein [Shewanella submarina]